MPAKAFRVANGMTVRTRHLAEVFAAAGIHSIAPGGTVPDISITGISDDSRRVRPGSCFVAASGTRQNGADFIEQAVAGGAVVVVGGAEVRERRDVSVVRVAQPREAVSRLAVAFHDLGTTSRRPLKLIGVTGTNGKTTVTFLLRSILKAAGHRPALFGTIEYDLVIQKKPAPLTTPGAVELCESLATARDGGADHAVFEVSSHALDQGRCDGLGFAAAIFTNLTGDHLDYHRSMDAYASAKKRLFEMLGPGAVAVINADDPRADEFAAASKAPVVRFGIRSENVDVRAELQLIDRVTARFVLLSRHGRMPVRLPLIGTHNVANSLAAASTALALGIAPEAVAQGLENTRGVPGRLQRVEPDGCPFSVLVDYAHTDDALRNVLTALRPITQGRIICVFGCGGDRDRGKRPRMGRVVGELADVAYVTSDNPRSENPRSIIEEILSGLKGCSGLVEVDVDRAGAIRAAIGMARPGDTVLIAGKGHETYQIVGDRVLAFDDVEVARQALDELFPTWRALQEEVA